MPIPPDELVTCQGSGPVITLVGLTRQLWASQVADVTFVFQDAGDVTLPVPVAVPLSPISTPPSVDVESPTQGPPLATTTSS